MKKILFISMILILVSCQVQHIAIKGNYSIKNEFISPKTYDDVWSNVIDLFAKNDHSGFAKQPLSPLNNTLYQ